jgi:hypothetical protein
MKKMHQGGWKMKTAKACEKCGCSLEDDMKCCPKCGFPVGEEPATNLSDGERSNESEYRNPNDSILDSETVLKEKSSGKKLVIIAFSILAVIFLFSVVGRIVHDYSINQDINEPQQASQSNIEEGSSKLGARFDFTLDEFTERINAVNRKKSQTDENFMTNDDWQNTDTKNTSGMSYEIYTYVMGNGKYTWVTNVDIASRKVLGVSMSTPTSVIKDEPEVYLTGLFLYIAAMYNIDYSKAGEIYEKMLNVRKSGVDAICTYHNTIFSYVTYGDKTELIIGPLSDDLKNKGNFIELE